MSDQRLNTFSPTLDTGLSAKLCAIASGKNLRVSEPAAAVFTVKPWATFTSARRAELQSGWALTDPQVFWLEKALVSIADHIRHKPRASTVRDELIGLRRELVSARDKPAHRARSITLAQKRLKRWLAASRLVPGLDGLREAMGHLGMACAAVCVNANMGIETVGDEPLMSTLFAAISTRLNTAAPAGTWGDLEALIVLAARAAERAVADRPRAKRTPTIASARAVQYIVDALARPKDSESALVAKRLRPTRADSVAETSELRPGSFGDLAKLVWATVTEQPNASPMLSIRRYMETTATPRPAGRPRVAQADNQPDKN